MKGLRDYFFIHERESRESDEGYRLPVLGIV